MSALDRQALRDGLLAVLRLLLEARITMDAAPESEVPWLLVDLLEDVGERVSVLRSSSGLPVAGLPPADGLG